MLRPGWGTGRGVRVQSSPGRPAAEGTRLLRGERAVATESSGQSPGHQLTAPISALTHWAPRAPELEMPQATQYTCLAAPLRSTNSLSPLPPHMEHTTQHHPQQYRAKDCHDAFNAILLERTSIHSIWVCPAQHSVRFCPGIHSAWVCLDILSAGGSPAESAVEGQAVHTWRNNWARLACPSHLWHSHRRAHIANKCSFPLH